MNKLNYILNPFKRLVLLILDFFYDIGSYISYSSVFNNSSQRKIEGKIIFYYHSIEKGLCNNPFRYGFGKPKIVMLIHYFDLWINKKYDLSNSQFKTACSVIVRYCDRHIKDNFDISKIISESQYNLIKSYSYPEVGGVRTFRYSDYFCDSSANFDLFSHSRHSVRHFQNEVIADERIFDSIRISRNAPSVCNRQSVHLTFVKDKDLIRKILTIQGGLNSSGDSVKHLFIVTSDRSSFVSVGERNQMYIDGGIFLMNLLYSLHYCKIGACPLHAALDFYDEIKIKKLVKLTPSEKIIAFVAIGIPDENFSVAFSKRKEVSEIMNVID